MPPRTVPRIEKQSPNGPPPPSQKTGTIADRIIPVSQIRTGLKFCIYGRGKTGKTRLACSFPKPLLLIGTEDGTKSIKTVPGVDFFRIRRFEEMEGVIEIVQSKYASGVLDTGGGFLDLAYRHVLHLEPDAPIKRGWGMTDRGTWGVINQQFAESVGRLIDLADQGETNIVIIAHERGLGDKDDETTSDVMVPNIGPALTPGAAGWLDGACDYMGNMFIREEVASKTEDLGMGPVTTTEKTGKKQYCLRIGPHSVYSTGFRHSLPSNEDLPEIVVNPTYDKLIRLIRGEIPEDKAR